MHLTIFANITHTLYYGNVRQNINFLNWVSSVEKAANRTLININISFVPGTAKKKNKNNK